MTEPPFDFPHFYYRLLRESALERTAAYWLRRGQQLADAARPRPNDNYGNATDDDIRARHIRLANMSRACQNRATLCDLTPGEELVLLDLYDYVAQVSTVQRIRDDIVRRAHAEALQACREVAEHLGWEPYRFEKQFAAHHGAEYDKYGNLKGGLSVLAGSAQQLREFLTSMNAEAAAA